MVLKTIFPGYGVRASLMLFLSKWCRSNVVDFRLPSVTQIADFLLHLFQDRKLQPNTIDGYRTAIAEMVGNYKLNISKDENLTRLLDSFDRDKSKGRQGCTHLGYLTGASPTYQGSF